MSAKLGVMVYADAGGDVPLVSDVDLILDIESGVCSALSLGAIV